MNVPQRGWDSLLQPLDNLLMKCHMFSLTYQSINHHIWQTPWLTFSWSHSAKSCKTLRSHCYYSNLCRCIINAAVDSQHLCTYEVYKTWQNSVYSLTQPLHQTICHWLQCQQPLQINDHWHKDFHPLIANIGYLCGCSSCSSLQLLVNFLGWVYLQYTPKLQWQESGEASSIRTLYTHGVIAYGIII